jgi:hypothetical protein
VKRPDPSRGLLLVGCSLAAAAPVILAQTIPASVSACAGETDDARRLACYDREMARELARLQTSAPPAAKPEDEFGLSERERRKQVEERAPERPAKLQKLVAAVDRVSSDAAGLAVIELANGQVWRQTEQVNGFYINSGESVTITPGALTSFWVKVDSRPPAHVRRVR